MTASDLYERAGEAWEQRAWAQARDAFTAADRTEPLHSADLERLAVAAYLSGDDLSSLDAWCRAFHALQPDDLQAAARCAFWQAFQLFNGGEPARANGWLARARRLLETDGHECAVQGLIEGLTAVQLLHHGDPAAAQAGFATTVRIGQKFDDRDVETLGLLGQGESLIALGQAAEGVALLDEVMAAVTADEVSPTVAGLAYCAVIGICRESFDLRRAAEWTAALSAWCAAQPELVAYRGQCQIHRSELLQLLGAWPEAMQEARAALDRLSRPMPHAALGAAYYQQAELHRLRGDYAAAEDAYGEAVRRGNPAQPGLALLRLAQGRIDTAQAAINRLLAEATDAPARCRVLPARVQICLAAGDLAGARDAADELGQLAADLDATYVRGLAAHATGAVLLAEGDVHAAQRFLRRACEIWRRLDVPYEDARTRALLAEVYRDLGDPDSAKLELDAAEAVFARLGAATTDAEPAGGLTDRELEVLRLVATGQSNRDIAKQLVISEKTVARHISNIFVKLGLNSRTAATAYAYEHHVV